MRVLVVTNMYPMPETPSHGTFVREHVESLRGEGVDVDVFFVNGRKSAWNYLWGLPRFWAWLLTHPRYDLIHSQYLHVNIIARMQFMCPLVVTNHSGDAYIKWQRRLTRIVSPFCDRIIAVSEDTKIKGHLTHAEVIPCGIDFGLFQPAPQREARRTLGLPEDKKLVLWAGEYFRSEKRFDIVQKAIEILKKRMPEVELVLVSGKPLPSVPAYMNACDVLLLVSDKEGSPMVVKEAMACNLPVVSVPAGDVAEIIGGTEGCYLCSQDPEDAAQKLELALQWGKRTNGRENIGHMEIGAISRRIIALYEEVLREKKGKGQPVSGYINKTACNRR
jgi:teichuronic acid biosynthesis glycosyltransferase TuaC